MLIYCYALVKKTTLTHHKIIGPGDQQDLKRNTKPQIVWTGVIKSSRLVIDTP